MGDAADDMYDAAMHEQECRSALANACPCDDGGDWFVNDDGLYECSQCGEVTDL